MIYPVGCLEAVRDALTARFASGVNKNKTSPVKGWPMPLAGGFASDNVMLYRMIMVIFKVCRL